MMQKKLPYLLIIFSFILPSFLESNFYPDQEISKERSIALKVMEETSSVLQKRYNLRPCGNGMNGKFEYLELSFEIRGENTRESLRSMLVDCSKEFLIRINENSKIKPFLKPYPFDQDNIGIVFFIKDDNNQLVFDPSICCAEISRGVLEFHTKSKANRFRYKNTFEESYEEALSKIAQAKKTAIEKAAK